MEVAKFQTKHYYVIVCGRCGGQMFGMLNSGPRAPGLSRLAGSLCCVLRQDTFTVPRSLHPGI